MRRLLPLLLLAAFCAATPARAEEAKPDDRVILDLSAEDWVTTQSARVNVSVEAAVTAANTGTMRADMTKAVAAITKADWRLTGFNRNQDQTGMERWSATFEARVPENQLGGLADTAKKQSKAGMQLTVASVDFSPTLAETEAVNASLRTAIYKQANDQLAALNSALPGRNYRIALINFSGTPEGGAPMPQVMRGYAKTMMAMDAAAAPASPPMERAEKITATAHVIFAVSPASTAK